MMQATNTTTFSNKQPPYISPVPSFFQNEFTKKIALIAVGIISVLAVIFLQEYGLAIVATLCVITFLTTNTKSAPPAASTSSQSTAVTAPSGLSHKFLPLGPRQSPGIEIVGEGGSIEAIHPPSPTTQSRELSRGSKWQEFMGKTTSVLEMPAYPEPLTAIASTENSSSEREDNCDLKTCGKALLKSAKHALETMCLIGCCNCALAYANVLISENLPT